MGPIPAPWEAAAFLAAVVSTLTLAACVLQYVRAVRSRDARRMRRAELGFPLPVVAASLVGFAVGVLVTDRHAEPDRDTAQNLIMPVIAGAAADALLGGRRFGRPTAVLLALLIATARAAVS